MKTIQELENLIRKHKELYYQGHPEISDSDFDSLEDQLRKIDPSNPTLLLVGSAPKGQNKVAHEIKMLSLEKTYDPNELKSWVEKNVSLSMFKFDGVSCSLIYQDENFAMAKTRGDGSVGENITECARWIKSIPKKILNHKKRIEIRGELVCSEENFLHLAEEMVKRGLSRPTSQRNIVAGLISRIDNIDLCRYLNFLAFDVIADDINFKEELEKFNFLKKNQFTVPDVTIHKNPTLVDEVIEETKKYTEEGEFQIDGLVFVYNNIEKQNELGVTSHHPKYKMAFKFQGESKTTIIKDISWGVSRNGILTPVAKVEPVELSGAIISNVTLHNFGMVRQFNLKRGDKIEIIRSGEVIPKFMSVIESTEGKYCIPEVCPSCKHYVETRDIRLVCTNSECPEKQVAILLNFIDKMNIEDIGDKRLLEMFKKGFVKSIPDLYRLNIDDLLKLEKTKEKLANKIYENIQKTRSVELPVLLASLGISGGAINKCRKIVMSGFETLESFKKITLEQLVEIEGLGEKSAQEFLISFKEKIPVLEELEKIGIKIKETVKYSLKLNGLSFCITGPLSEKREIIEERIRLFGGQVQSGVSSKTSYLVTNEQESTSSKMKNAQKYSIPIINEQELKKLLE